MAIGRFQFRPVLTICTLIALVILVSLGTWQLQRLQWKRGLIAQVESRVEIAPIPFEEAVVRTEAGENMEYAPVRLDGRWLPHGEAAVFGSYEGRAGAYLFAPLGRESGAPIYVNLGYLPQSMAAPSAYQPRYLNGQDANITGLFRYAERPTPPASWFRPTEKSQDGLWFVRDPMRFAAAAGMETQRYYIDQSAVAERPWPKAGTTRLEFHNRHLEYALTWFGLGVALIGVWLIFSLPRSSNSNNFKK